MGNSGRDLEIPPTGMLSRLALSVQPLDRKMEQVFHNFVVNLYVLFRLILQTGDNV